MSIDIPKKTARIMFQGEQKRYPSNVLQRMKFLKFRLHGALLVEFDWSLSHPPEIQDEIHWNCDMWKSWSHSLRLLMALNYLFSFQRNFRGNSCYTMLYLLEIAVLLSLTWQIEQQSRTCLAFFSPPSSLRSAQNPRWEVRCDKITNFHSLSCHEPYEHIWTL